MSRTEERTLQDTDETFSGRVRLGKLDGGTIENIASPRRHINYINDYLHGFLNKIKRSRPPANEPAFRKIPHVTDIWFCFSDK